MNELSYEKRLIFHEIETAGKDAWAVDYFLPVLFHIDMNTLDIGFESWLPTDDLSVCGQYTSIKYHNGKLIIIPHNSKYVIIYDVFDHKINYKVDISELVETNANQLFTDIVIVDEFAYLLPGRSHVIIRIDLNTYCVDTICGWYSLIKQYISDDNRIICRKAFYAGNGVILFPLFQTGVVLCVSIFTGKSDIKELDSEPLTSVLSHENGYYFSLRDKAVIYDCDLNFSYKDSIEFPSNYNNCSGISRIVLWEDNLVLFPRNGEAVWLYNTISKENRLICRLPKDYEHEHGQAGLFSCGAVAMEKDVLLFVSVKEGALVRYNFESGELIKKDLKMNKNDKKRIITYLNNRQIIIDNSDIFFENYYFDFYDFLVSIENE